MSRAVWQCPPFVQCSASPYKLHVKQKINIMNPSHCHSAFVIIQNIVFPFCFVFCFICVFCIFILKILLRKSHSCLVCEKNRPLVDSFCVSIGNAGPPLVFCGGGPHPVPAVRSRPGPRALFGTLCCGRRPCSWVWRRFGESLFVQIDLSSHSSQRSV